MEPLDCSLTTTSTTTTPTTTTTTTTTPATTTTTPATTTPAATTTTRINPFLGSWFSADGKSITVNANGEVVFFDGETTQVKLNIT